MYRKHTADDERSVASRVHHRRHFRILCDSARTRGGTLSTGTVPRLHADRLSRFPLVRRLLEVRVLVDDRDVADRRSAGFPGFRRYHRRGGLRQELRPRERDDDGAGRRGEEYREHTHRQHRLGVLDLLLIVLVDLVQGAGPQGRLHGRLRHPRQRDEHLLLEVEIGADPDQYRHGNSGDDAGDQAAESEVHGLALELVDLDLRAGDAEQDRLEYHPEDLERRGHRVLQRGEKSSLLVNQRPASVNLQITIEFREA